MSSSDEKKVKLPWKLRLKAWWEGYDPEELRLRLLAQAGDDETQSAPAPEKTEFETRDVEPSDAPEEEMGWSEDAVNIAQYIWGEGYCGPGGPEYIVALSKLLALSPEMSMLQIGASLGGPARVLADEFGVWMTGYEESPILVDKAQELSKMAGLERKAVITQYNPEEIEEFERKFDRALAKEALFTIENKAKMIAAIEDKLKPGGLILITDYVISSEAVVASDSYKEWKIGERTTPYPVLADDLKAILKKNHLQVRVSEDISPQYIEMINQAWAGADQVAAKLAKQDDGTKQIQTLMREAEFWARRKKMLESGELQLLRIVANKKAGGPGGMSDW
ncbi:methyltransferase domain-containing protein [Kordiimonas sp. SCSIO 12610]|uniref:methyltransferase domain-containing protein n=1 Tax=Kordiimonas sp. SCSIO 12610 TaxID=2829597 RepID=UPI00210E72ED|nr:methyltransferase domain-containing protein [Kordiimonas sp. SCSIO 12610]UTW55291.1 methyltransferase domain-containing protein [Kordiimonas sp. SCSIO 12610]